MAHYRKKPVIVEAVRLTDDTREEVLRTFVPNHQTPLVVVSDEAGHVRYGEITTLEGTMRVAVGDYILRGVAGELSSCTPAIFDATYVLVAG